MSNVLFTEAEIAEKFGVHRKTLYFWRLQGMPFVEISRLRIAYDEVPVREWMKANLKGPYGKFKNSGRKGAKKGRGKK